jgi:ribosomal-protein-alanine N-acetyltransferase
MAEFQREQFQREQFQREQFQRDAFQIRPMALADLDAVCEIERESFSIPWSRNDFHYEITQNKLALYLVAWAPATGRVAGYGGMWHVVTEGHITNIAVAPAYRGRGLGDALLAGLIALGREREMIGLTLEVRVGNRPAMNLYAKYGFKVEGLRKNYYADTKEDAVIMWRHLENEQ